MSWFMQKPNEKLLSCVIILWEVIYVHFYNWDKPLDLVSVVYDLIELIIEVSLWSKEFFTLDTHPQHTRLWFNECLSHLCDCTCSNVMCMPKYLLNKPKNIFECFICFLKWFYTFVSYVFVQMHFCVFLQKLVQRLSREKLATYSFPRKGLKGNNLFHLVTQKLSRLYRDYLTTNSFSRNAV